MLAPPVRRLAVAVSVLVMVLVPALIVQAQELRRTQILSPPGEPTAADGPSDNTSFSRDGLATRLVGYDSMATNLVAGDTNGKRDVFVMTRAGGEGGLTGVLQRVSVSTKNVQGNGDSSKPSFDGDVKRKPHCVTFQSTATNLDALSKRERRDRRQKRRKLDKTSDSDVYMRDLKTKETFLVSVGHKNATNGVVDGECEFVTYEAARTVWVRDLVQGKTTKIAKGTNPDQNTNGKGVAYERGGQIRWQAFQRVFNRGNPVVKKQGRELLVSDAASGGGGNGVSQNPTVDDNGHYVAFESTATNLCTGRCKVASGGGVDRNGAVSDIYRRTISSKAPTKDTMQVVSYSFAVDQWGDGASNNPDMTGAGENIVFDSEAANLKESEGIRLADPNGAIRDIYYWNFPRERLTGNVSRESRSETDRATGQPYNGASTNPGASNRANYIGFTSVQTGQSGESNGPSVPDVFIRFLGGSDED